MNYKPILTISPLVQEPLEGLFNDMYLGQVSDQEFMATFSHIMRASQVYNKTMEEMKKAGKFSS